MPKPDTCTTTGECVAKVHQFSLCTAVNVSKMAEGHVTASLQMKCVCDNSFGYYRDHKTCSMYTFILCTQAAY